MPQVLLEGYTIAEVLELPDDQFRHLVLTDEPLVFRIGSASILGKFKITTDILVVDLVHIDGGGEGALLTLALLANRYARRASLSFVEWRVHAVHCASPNLKLRQVLQRKGFVVRTVEGVGECYWLRSPSEVAEIT